MPIFFKRPALLFLMLILSGCPTPPKPHARVTPLEPEFTPAITPVPQTNPPPVVVQVEPAPPPQKILTNPPASDIWISWKNWAATNGFAPPRRVHRPNELAYELHTGKTASLIITIGSRFASWNGFNLGLGFGPQLVDGQPFVNALDAEKTFEPLLSLAPLPQAKNRRTIVLDPGHGGENYGTKSILNGHFEKEFTLDWALRLRPLLKAAGWKVLLTRTNDIDIPLSERVEFANRARADLFLSLHFNSSGATNGAPERGGVETFCLTPAGMPSHLTRDFEDDSGHVFPNNAFDIENVRYATRLHESLVQHTGQKDRGIRRARFMTVIREQNRPAVLLEGGFLSDPQEARLINTVGYRQLLAEAVSRALRE